MVAVKTTYPTHAFMNLLEAIRTRRSIRKFLPKAVEKKDLQTMLEAAMDAPSALDEQPWQFIVMTESAMLQRLPEHHNHCDLVRGAPAAILICGDQSLEKLPGFWVQDCAACTQNLLLAAHELGLGAVWVGVHPTPCNVNSLQTWLNLPDSVVPFALVAVGYPDEPYPEKINFKPERIHWNRW